VVDEDRLRVWAARLAAPLAFFFAALVLILLVQSALSAGSEDDQGAATAPTTTAAPTGTSPTTTEERKPRRFYRVRPGDTLESIGAKFETSVDVLIDLNPGIDPLALSPGQRIRIR
jgi:LysM repeat protein